jgi:ubiquitin-protein ligase
MHKSAKRVYTELNTINIKNHGNPNSKKFIIDTTPFNDDPSEPPALVKDDHGEYYIITGRILPTSNIYNRSAFIIKLKVPTEYPFKPPQVEMVTPIYHPNVGPQGKICIPMLRSTNAWKATNILTDVIDSVVDYIDRPNIDEAESSG